MNRSFPGTPNTEITGSKDPQPKMGKRTYKRWFTFYNPVFGNGPGKVNDRDNNLSWIFNHITPSLDSLPVKIKDKQLPFNDLSRSHEQRYVYGPGIEQTSQTY